MLRLLNGKGGFIVAGLSLIAGIVFFFCFDTMKDAYEGPNAVRPSFIMSLVMNNLGRYGTSALFFAGSAVIGLKSWMSLKSKNQD